MRAISKILSILVFSLLSAVASAAGSEVNTTVTSVGVDVANNRAVITVASYSGGPSCGAMKSTTMGISLSTTAGREALAIAQLSVVSGRQVSVYGTGTCTVYSHIENLSRIVMFKDDHESGHEQSH